MEVALFDNDKLFTVLVVDDTPMNREILSVMLEDHQYHVQNAESGKVALEIIDVTPPDMILLDISMPEMDGFEVCETIKNNPKTSSIPIIFISALNDTQDKVRAFEAGGVDYIEKPFYEEEVLARVSVHLNICALQQKLEIQNEQLRENIQHLKLAYHALKSQEATEKKDLKKAQDIQLQILPVSFPPLTGLDICGFYSPATSVGGDFIDTVPITDTKTAVMLADVSGHGIAAAMVTVFLHQYIQSCKVENKEESFASPSHALTYLNQAICNEKSLSSTHVTMIYVVLDSENKTVELASAGHPAPLCIESGQSRFIDQTRNPALGLNSNTTFASSTLDFPEGASLVLYTDGLMEARDPKGAEFHLDPSDLARHALDSSAICSYLERALLVHIDDGIALDDISFVVIHASTQETAATGYVKIHQPKQLGYEEETIPEENGISVATEDYGMILKAKGRLDWTYADAINSRIAATENKVYFDLTHCSYMDSTMLGTLHRNATKLKLYHVPNRLKKQFIELGIFDNLQITKAIPWAPNFQPLQPKPVDVKKMGTLIFEAHQHLSDINDENKEAFSSVMDSLRSEIENLHQEK